MLDHFLLPVGGLLPVTIPVDAGSEMQGGLHDLVYVSPTDSPPPPPPK